jgi:hypothetical protein
MSEANPITSVPVSMTFDPETGGYLLHVAMSEVETNRTDTVLATGTAKSAYWTSADQKSNGALGAYILWDIVTQPVSGSIQMFIDIKNDPSGDYTCIYQTGEFCGTGTVNTIKKYLLYPGAVDTGSQLTGVCQLPIPPVWRIRIDHVSPLVWDYSVMVAYVGS